MKTGDKERGWCLSWFSGRQTQDRVVSSAVYWGATCVKGRGRPRIEAGWGGGTVRAGCTPDRASVHPLESPRQSPRVGGNTSRRVLSTASPPLPQRHSINRE